MVETPPAQGIRNGQKSVDVEILSRADEVHGNGSPQAQLDTIKKFVRRQEGTLAPQGQERILIEGFHAKGESQVGHILKEFKDGFGQCLGTAFECDLQNMFKIC